MNLKLFFSAVTKFALGFVITAALLFLSAGTVRYPNGQLFLLLLFLPMFLAGVVLMAVNPALLRRRLQAKERQGEQRLVVGLSGLMFLLGFVLAGLDFRFGWSRMPGWLTGSAAVVFLAAYGLYAEVLRENTWLSRTVEVREGQQVVDTGLYGVVRHPMYAATVLLFLSMPLVLGSWVSFGVFLCYPGLLAKRIKNEEQVLEAELEGYARYKSRVKYRLIPYVW